MTVTRYRKKPVEVDTIQWTGDNEAEIQAFTGGASNFYALDDEDRDNSDDPDATATVYDKLHSTWVLVYTGQHIVRGVKGEFYPIAEDVLAETYEAAESAGRAPAADRAAVRAEAFEDAAEMLSGLDPVKAALAGQHAWNDAAGLVRHMAVQERRLGGEAQQDPRPRCPHCQLPHDLTPGSPPVAACKSIRASLAKAKQLHAEGDHSSCAAVDCEVVRARREAQQDPAQDGEEAHPPQHTWKVESPRRDQWASWGATYDERDWARERYEDAISHAPARAFRLVRATTTYTVEAEHNPAAPARPDQPETAGEAPHTGGQP